MSVELQEVLDHLKKQHIRITETRKAIIAYVMDSHDHPSAEMIYQDLLPTYPNLSLATVYNNLKLLLEAGFVTEIKRNNDTTTYYDFMGHDHINLICEQCGKILDIEVERPSLVAEVEATTDFQIRKEIVTLYGICPDCQKMIKI